MIISRFLYSLEVARSSTVDIVGWWDVWMHRVVRRVGGRIGSDGERCGRRGSVGEESEEL